MSRPRGRERPVLAALIFTVIAGCATGRGDEVWHHRNLGRALYENPATSRQAVDELKKALDLAPESARERVNYGLALLRVGREAEGAAELERVQRSTPTIPHTWFNLGLLYKKRGNLVAAAAQFERMVTLADRDATSHFNLGYLYSRLGKTDQALAELSRASELDRLFAAPHYLMYTIYRGAGAARAADAARELQLFEEARYGRARTAMAEDVDWGPYAELIDELRPSVAAVADRATPRFRDELVDAGANGPARGLVVLDANGDGHPDVLTWSDAGPTLFDRGRRRIDAFDRNEGRPIRAVAPGDFDNDGFQDLCVVSGTGAVLYRNAGGRFARVPNAEWTDSSYAGAVWIDYDHDYDLDLVLLGPRTRLLRNSGAAGFSDYTRQFPFVAGHSLEAIVFDREPDVPGHDLLVTYRDRGGVLYHDRLAGTFAAESLPGVPAGGRGLVARDLDADGRTDVAIGGDAPLVLFNRVAGFEARPLRGGSGALLPIDLFNAGRADLMHGRTLVRPIVSGDHLMTLTIPDVDAAASADFDEDGRSDLAIVASGGAVHLLINQSPAQGRSLRIRLDGIKNLKLASLARVEVRAGSLYQKQIYAGVPLVFGLARSARVDAVRITWPNGLIQSESTPDHLVMTYREAQRLSGSCPMVFTWNGRGFEFISDVLGVAPLGASAGEGTVFPLDHDEYVHIPAGSLVPRGGEYEVRITEELREVSYLDRVQLIAVDHPQAIDLISNEKFKGPPFPEFRLFGVGRRIYPVGARSGTGADVRDRLRRRDGRYPDDFAHDYNGVAELHDLVLDFGNAAPGNRAVLVLSGWVDWADGSTFRAVSQERPQGLTMPSLAVKDAAGRWQTVVEDMGFPAGKPKTIAVDLTDRFLSSSRQIRIRTDLCIYWDEIFLSENPEPPAVRLHSLDPTSVGLRFRGFSRPTIDPAREQPESFRYDEQVTQSSWNQIPGLYTRYGDVTPLLRAVDDRLAILGSGDELRLIFAASVVPALPAGWTRDFFLFVDGWAKDGDPNTSFSRSVEPLPFHGMSGYPYRGDERYPDDPLHEEYRRTYNTRPALRLIRPLTSR